MMHDECSDCGGEVQAEVTGKFKDWVCQDCGLISGGKLVVEEEEKFWKDDDSEVME